MTISTDYYRNPEGWSAERRRFRPWPPRLERGRWGYWYNSLGQPIHRRWFPVGGSDPDPDIQHRGDQWPPVVDTDLRSLEERVLAHELSRGPVTLPRWAAVTLYEANLDRDLRPDEGAALVALQEALK